MEATGCAHFKEAFTVYEQAIQVDPKKSLAYFNKAYILSEFKRYDEALAAIEQAVRVDHTGYSYIGKGEFLRSLGRYEEAKQAFEQARQLGWRF